MMENVEKLSHHSFLVPIRDSSLSTELVVAESVVVIKKLLQMQPEKHSDIIKHMAKLTDNIQVSVPLIFV